MSATDSPERGRAEPIDVEFEETARPRKRTRRSSSGGGIGFGAALLLAAFAALAGAALGALAPRIPAVASALDQVAPAPAAPAAAPAPDASQFSGLDQRVRTIEGLIAPTAEAASAGGDVSARVIALQAGLNNVESRLAQLPNSQQIQELVAEVQQLRAQVPALEQQSRVASESARAAFAVTAAADASRSSGPFEQSYGALAALLPDNPHVQALAPLARTGAPTRVELRDQFADLENDIVRASRIANAGAGFWGRIQAALAQWVTIRRRGEGDTTVGVVERASRRLAADDLAGAVQEVSRLSGAPARTAEPWLTAARRRLAIDTHLTAIRTELSRRS